MAGKNHPNTGIPFDKDGFPDFSGVAQKTVKVPHTGNRSLRDARSEEALFARALEHVLRMEGGYTDDPHDPGGPTNLGITLAEFARHRGVPLDEASYGELKSALRRISREEAAGIYRRDYWNAAQCPHLPAALAVFHFDAAVNQGVMRASRMLQSALGVAADGQIGRETLAAAAGVAFAPAPALERYAAERRAHYRSLSTFWRFGRGWLARVDATLALARGIATNPQFTPSQETSRMPTDTPADAPRNQTSKWWGQSLTIWGVLVTALSTVLPVVGPLIGIDLTPDLVQQLGDGVARVIQAIGGLVGTALAIWGRARANTAIGRRQFILTV